MAAFLTPKEVASRWTCSPEHVQRLCASGKLRAMKLGRRGWRISEQAVIDFETRSTPATDTTEAPAVRQRAVRQRGLAPAVELDGPYEPVFAGPVPWRSAVIDAASSAAGRGRSAHTKKAALPR